jgi:ADP-ribose pyrophosphatase YjhB (NUDIX family)
MATIETPLHQRLLIKAAQRVWRLSRGLTLGTRAIVLDAQERVLLVRHGYMAGWHLPGGGVERGEAIEVALARELLEETGVAVAPGDAELIGIYTNFASYPGDHIAAFRVRRYTQDRQPPPSFEIRERGFFAVDRLPEGVGAGTARRLAEQFQGAPRSVHW